jgi:hypothetical protein
MSAADGLAWNEEVGSAILSALTRFKVKSYESRAESELPILRFILHSPLLTLHLRKAGRYKLAAPVLKTGSVSPRGRSITDAFRHFSSRSSKAERPADNRKTAERYRAGRPSR